VQSQRLHYTSRITAWQVPHVHSLTVRGRTVYGQPVGHARFGVVVNARICEFGGCESAQREARRRKPR
jgi:hypothetical protein